MYQDVCVVFTLGSHGLPGAPKELQGAPKGLPRAPWGGVGLPGARIMCVHNGHFVFMCSFFCYCELSFLKICVSSNNFLLCKGGVLSLSMYVDMCVCMYVRM